MATGGPSRSGTGGADQKGAGFSNLGGPGAFSRPVLARLSVIFQTLRGKVLLVLAPVALVPSLLLRGLELVSVRGLGGLARTPPPVLKGNIAFPPAQTCYFLSKTGHGRLSTRRRGPKVTTERQGTTVFNR